MQDKITIGIPTYNGAQRVESLLINLRQRTPSDIPYEIIICDDSGKEEHRSRVKIICDKYNAKFIKNTKNSGVPFSWNRLVEAGDSKHIILLNDDILVANQWLRQPWYAMQNNPLVGSFSLYCYFIDPGDVPALLVSPEAKIIPLNVRWVGNNLIRNERFTELPKEVGHNPGRTMAPAGCSFGFTREMWNKVGGFDERYHAFYEETCFGVSCAQLGFPSMQLGPPPGNYHIWSQTFATASEINAGQIMQDSKRKFIEKWTARLGIQINDAPDIHPFLMDKIPPIEVKWLDENCIERTSII